MVAYMNYVVDIAIIVILILFIFIFGHLGFVKCILKSCKWIVSLVATYLLYPIISSFIRKTVVFEGLKGFINSVMSLDNLTAATGSGQINTINSLTLPEGFKSMLMDNNNSVIYELLGVNTLKDYIAGYVANIILNIVVSTLVFIIIAFIIRSATSTLELAVKLPIIKQINGIGGVALGLFWGVMCVWVLMAITTLFIATPFFANLVISIDQSILGKILYDNNLIMNVVLAKLFGWG